MKSKIVIALISIVLVYLSTLLTREMAGSITLLAALISAKVTALMLFSFNLSNKKTAVLIKWSALFDTLIALNAFAFGYLGALDSAPPSFWWNYPYNLRPLLFFGQAYFNGLLTWHWFGDLITKKIKAYIEKVKGFGRER